MRFIPNYLTIQKQQLVFILFFVWSAILLFISDWDSPLFDPYLQYDSSIFFLCGKALMNGMTPYVDFSDSKGILLMIIYGLGYLLSSTSKNGVYIISIFSYAVTFFYLYRTALVYCKSTNRSILYSLAVGLLMTWSLYHNEVRAESFCWPATAIALFQISNIYYNGNDRTVCRAMAILGLCFAWCFMIKFTIAAMHVIFFIAALPILYSNKQYIKPLLFYLCAIFLFFLPFVVYLFCVNAFTAFIQEYFINTVGITKIHATSEMGALGIYLNDLLASFGLVPGRQYLCMALIPVVCAIYSACLYRQGRGFFYSALPFVLSSFFFGLSVYHAYWPYYLESCTPFAIFPIVFVGETVVKLKLRTICIFAAFCVPVCAILYYQYHMLLYCFFLFCLLFIVIITKILSNGSSKVNMSSAVLLLAIICVVTIYNSNFWTVQSFKYNPKSESYRVQYRYAEEIHKLGLKHPKIVEFNLDCAIGITEGVLPGCKYFFSQNLESEIMQQDKIDAIEQRIPDVVLYPNWGDFHLYNGEYPSTILEHNRYKNLSINNYGYCLWIK